MFIALLIIIFTCLLSVSLYLCLSRKQVATKEGKFVFLRVTTNQYATPSVALASNYAHAVVLFQTIISLQISKDLWYVDSTSLGITSSRRQRKINVRLSTVVITCLCLSLRFCNLIKRKLVRLFNQFNRIWLTK